mmetsp:Transcript_25063/g.60786  ORF Transcript_25063/g.60786 Transcript_25063/m.60786 type:complete len:103 (+) Transcript_25063:43-351(+)
MSVFGFCCESNPLGEQFEVITKPVVDSFAWAGNVSGAQAGKGSTAEEVQEFGDHFDVATPLVEPYMFASEATSASFGSDELAFEAAPSYASRKFARLGGDLL